MGKGKLISNAVGFWKRHDRTILKGISIGASITAVILAWNARPKCEEILEELNAAGASNAEKAKALIPVVGPVVGTVAIGVVSELVEYKTTGDKLSTAINAASTIKSLSDIRKDAEKELLPKEKADEIEKQVAKKKLESILDEEIEETGHGDTLIVDAEFSGRVWRGSKDFFYLAIARINNKIANCYNRYGLCVKEDHAATVGDIFREQGMIPGKFLDQLVFMARDYKNGIPVQLVATEFERNGKTELGYLVECNVDPTFLPE